MAFYSRPAVNENDTYVQKIVKYIPSEVVAAYMAFMGNLVINGEAIPKTIHSYVLFYLISVSILALITPFWTYFAVIDGTDPKTPDKVRKKRAMVHAGIALVAFLIWVYAIGNPLLNNLFCGCLSSELNCKYPQNNVFFSGPLPSILLGLFTLITPLIERVFLGEKIPPSVSA